jgi:hypothetical protein
MGDANKATNPLNTIADQWQSFEKKYSSVANVPFTTLTFTSASAQQCAQAIDEALGQVQDVVQKIQTGSLKPDPAWFGVRATGKHVLNNHASNGNQLVDRFHTASDDVVTILNSHAVILADMGQTFLNAAQQYQFSEDLSQQGFATASKASTSAQQQELAALTSESMTWPGAPAGPDGALLDQSAPTQYTGAPAQPNWQPSCFAANPAAAHLTPDVWQSYPYADCHNLYKSIDSAKVATVAGNWKWLTNVLVNAFDKLNSTIASVSSDQWSGNGFTAVQSAMSTYKQQTDELTKHMYNISDALYESSAWLGYVRSNMPSSPEPPAATVVETTAAGTTTAYVHPSASAPETGSKYWPVLTNTYWGGSMQSSMNLPTLQTAAVKATTAVQFDNQSGNGGGDGSNSDAAKLAAMDRLLANQFGSNTDSPGSQAAALSAAEQAARQSGSQAAGSGIAGTGAAGSSDTGTAAAGTGAVDSPGATGASDTTASAGSSADPLGAVSQAMQAGQQGLQSLQQAAQQAEAAKAQDKALAGLPGGLSPLTGAKLPGMNLGGGGAGGSTALASEAKQALEAESKLFPGASAAMADEESLLGRAGAANGSGYGGSPGGMGGAGNRGQDKEKPRSTRLDSTRHLDAAIDDNIVAVKPVLGAVAQEEQQ